MISNVNIGSHSARNNNVIEIKALILNKSERSFQPIGELKRNGVLNRRTNVTYEVSPQNRPFDAVVEHNIRGVLLHAYCTVNHAMGGCVNAREAKIASYSSTTVVAAN